MRTKVKKKGTSKVKKKGTSKVKGKKGGQRGHRKCRLRKKV